MPQKNSKKALYAGKPQSQCFKGLMLVIYCISKTNLHSPGFLFLTQQLFVFIFV